MAVPASISSTSSLAGRTPCGRAALLVAAVVGGCGAPELGGPSRAPLPTPAAYTAQSHPSGVALPCTHWYSGDSSMLDSSVAAGRRGFNVETVIGSSSSPDYSLAKSRLARDHGLANIIRIDYRSYQAVPYLSRDYDAWAREFFAIVGRFTSEGLATLFIVGNEPNLEGKVTAAEYVAAYNYLYRHAARPAGIELLVAGPGTFSPDVKVTAGTRDFDFSRTFLDWLGAVSAGLTSSDGFALHTYGDPNECGSPGNACPESLGRFSRNFISFREQIDRVAPRWNGKLVYLTETNTFTGPALASPYTPLYNYADNWLNEAFALVRDYNRTRGSKPEVRSLCWFVDRNDGGWGDFSLRGSGRLAQARQDLTEEFKNPANRPGAAPPTCSTAGLATPTDRWKLELWDNRSFTGAAVEQRYDAAGAGGFDFSYGSGRASLCTGSDNFAIRFSRKAAFPATADYTFTTTTDDGVRLWVDGALLIDKWSDMGKTSYSATRRLTAGTHELRMDYYENAGDAAAALRWSSAPVTPTCACRSDVDNFCHYSPRTAGCGMTFPGGYCDPNGDGSYGDADWTRGYTEFHAACP